MKIKNIYFLFSVIACIVSLTGCGRSGREMWEDTKTCGRYMGRGVRSLFGQHIDSREYAYSGDLSWEGEDLPFIPLAGSEDIPGALNHTQTLLAAKESPGDPHSKIPGIDQFLQPIGTMAAIFHNITFDTDSFAITSSESCSHLQKIADYLHQHPHTYVFIEGHADERGAAAYNLALGAKRANAVQDFLIKNGVPSEQLFTISYGKERPLVQGHDESSWQKNRRAQFRLYDKK